MNVLAHQTLHAPASRFSTWAARAWRRMRWKHVLLGCLVPLLSPAIHPLGGALFPPTDLPPWDVIYNLLEGGLVITGMVIAYCVLVADEAFDDGVPPLRAYGVAAIAMAIILPANGRLLVAILIALQAIEHRTGADEGVAQLVWWSQVTLYEAAFGLSIYAYWRVTQRALRRAQAAETEQVRNEQRVQTARLLALQSRVEPQVLFDALHRVLNLHSRDADAADALLADLIALLRAIQPSVKKDTSSVEREFELVEAWVRVTRSAGHGSARVRMHLEPEARNVGLAPMLVLPLLRSVLRLPGANQAQWLLNASVIGPRLIIVLRQADVSGEQMAIDGTDLSSLGDRLAELFGELARLTVSHRPPSVELNLPRLLEDDDDDRADR